ncbi:MAG: GtrA family protein [Oscillospiraceae bacterium]|jgi:putative flippase GtrA|nr:GtrA family protein [Oscillospiraceae bacterium]
MQKIKELFDKYWSKYKELVFYLVFGALTTAVNIAGFWSFEHIIRQVNIGDTNFAPDINTAIAWFISVLFAYITNKIWVFESKNTAPGFLLKEIASFFGARALTGLMDLAIMHVFVTIMGFNSMLIKILSNILVIILNYILSKLIVFRKKKNKEKQ